MREFEILDSIAVHVKIAAVPMYEEIRMGKYDSGIGGLSQCQRAQSGSGGDSDVCCQVSFQTFLRRAVARVQVEIFRDVIFRSLILYEIDNALLEVVTWN